MKLDWNDLHRAYGPDGLREFIETAPSERQKDAEALARIRELS